MEDQKTPLRPTLACVKPMAPLSSKTVQRVWFSTIKENPEEIVDGVEGIRYARWFHGAHKTYGYFQFQRTVSDDIALDLLFGYEVRIRPMRSIWESANQQLYDLAEGLCPGGSSLIVEYGKGPARARWNRFGDKAFPVSLI